MERPTLEQRFGKVEDLPLDRLAKTASEVHLLLDPETKSLNLEGVERFPCSPTEAIGLVKRKLAIMRRNRVIPVETRVQVADHTTLVIVTKEVYVPDQLIQESMLCESYEKIHITPMFVEKSFFSKSIVIDAREVNPEVIDFPIDDDKEIDVRKIEVEVMFQTNDPIIASYTFSGYDRGCDVWHKGGALKLMSEAPLMYLEPVEGMVQFRVITSVAEVRSFYTYRNKIHKKFDKYNPRQYCYFTVYAVSDGIIKEAAMNLCRIFKYMDEPAGRIYKGPVYRKGRVTCSNDKPKYTYKYTIKREKRQLPSPMTDSRQKLIDIALGDGGLAPDIPLTYELSQIQSQCSVTETYEDNGTLRKLVHHSAQYQLKERKQFLSQGLLFYDTCDTTGSGDDHWDKIIDSYYRVTFPSGEFDRVVLSVVEKYVFEVRSDKEIWVYSENYPLIADVEIEIRSK